MADLVPTVPALANGSQEAVQEMVQEMVQEAVQEMVQENGCKQL